MFLPEPCRPPRSILFNGDKMESVVEARDRAALLRCAVSEPETLTVSDRDILGYDIRIVEMVLRWHIEDTRRALAAQKAGRPYVSPEKPWNVVRNG